MAFIRPSLSKIIQRSQADIETRLDGAVASLRRTVERALARAVAGLTHGLHGHLVWLSKQLFPDTAEAEFLARWASIWSIERSAAVKASGTITITGVDTTVCPDETLWQDNNGVVYVQDGDATISGASATATVDAQDGGADGNQEAGATLSLVNPVTGIDSSATVSGSGITGGVNEESDESLLNQLLQRLSSSPKGGGPGDYVAWVLEVSGVTRAWQIANVDGPGTVGLYFVMDEKVGTIIPDAGEVSTVQLYLDSKAPIIGTVTAYAPTAVDVDYTISITPDTSAVRAAVEAELEDLVSREGAADGVTIYLSQINEAISLATGETDHTVTVPAADLTFTLGQIPVHGTITWA